MGGPGPAYALFDTSIGRCGIAWGTRGVLAVHLPDRRDDDTRARLLQRLPGASEAAPPPDIQRAIDAIGALLQGKESDLRDIVLDMHDVPPFHRRVYDLARAVGPGSTISYGELAERLGSPGSARAVGQALGRNPFAIVVPCHRVLAAGGKVGGFSATGGITTKLRMLTLESASGGARASARPATANGRPVPPPASSQTYGFDVEAAVAHLRAVDPKLARVMDAVGSFRMRLDATPSLFGALAESIVYQQLSGKAAATIFARVRALFPRPHEPLTPQQILRASDDKLRGAGLSRSKLLSLRDLAARAAAGEIPTIDEVQGLDDQAIIDRLTHVRGIGRWTVEMMLIFRLGRPDVLPIDDYGVRKGFAVAYRKRTLPTPRELERHGAKWRPYRTVASWYLWRATELATKKI